MSQKEFEKMRSFLKEKNVPFKLIEHEPVFTSHDAARVRGARLSEGVKAIVLKSDSGKFVLACVPGDKKVDTKKLAQLAGAKRLFLASPSEVLEVTGCEVGSVSPLCAVFGLKTFFDKKILEKASVEFNAGLHTKSIRMAPHDLVFVLKPELEDFGF